QPPGVPAGAQYFQLYPYPALDSGGAVSFPGQMLTPVGQPLGGVTTNDDQAIWSEATGSLALVGREGQQATGAPAGALFGSLFGLPYSDEAAFAYTGGWTAFTSNLRTGVGGVNSLNDTGLWVSGPSGTSLLAREGAAAPGTS